MKVSRNNLKRILVSSFVLFVIFANYPYVFQCFLPIPNIYITYIFSIVISCVILLNVKHWNSLPNSFNVICLIQICVWILYSIYQQDITYITRVSLIIQAYILLLILDSKVDLINFLKQYNAWIVLQVVLGALAFVLIFLNLLEPLFEFTNVDQRQAACYGLTCTNQRFGDIIRISGYFDEPGALAYWGIWALVFNKIFIKNKRNEFVLIIGLFFTLSVAYFVQLMIYFILFYKFNLRNILPIFIILSIFCVLIFQTKNTSFDLYQHTFKRLEYDSDKGIVGNTRAELSNKAKMVFMMNPLLGLGAQRVENIDYMNDNPYETLAKDGIVGTIIIYLPLIYLCFKRRKVTILSAIILLGIGYLQRPFHVNLLHYFVLYLFSILIIRNVEKKNG